MIAAHGNRVMHGKVRLLRWLAIPAIVGIVGLLGAVPAAATDVLPGSDLFLSPAPPGGLAGATYDDLGNSPLPADFFGPGSDPFDGVIHLEGLPFSVAGPLGFETADTIVERLTTAVLPDDYTSEDTVDTVMVALSLASTSPITVTFDGGPDTSLYDVQVCLSSFTPQPGGWMTIRHLCPEGGKFESLTPVIPRLIFTKVSGSSGVSNAVLDPAPQLDFVVTDGCWAHSAPVSFGVYKTIGGVADHDCDGVFDAYYPASSPDPNGFVVGVCMLPCDDSGTTPEPRKRMTVEEQLWASHGILPAEEEGLDTEGDGVHDLGDNCPEDFNPLQTDSDNDTVGDDCDNCVDDYNPFQEDTDEDGIGDACDIGPYDVLPGYDLWVTPDEGSYLEFGGSTPNPPIPADYFWPGSDPFEGVINLVGDPIFPALYGDVSTIVERLERAILPDPIGSSDTIDTQLTGLQLRSAAPITVTGVGGPGEYDVMISLDPGIPSTGQMTIHHETIEGGTYDGVSFQVYVQLDFMALSGPGGDVTAPPEYPYLLEGIGPYGWQHDPPFEPQLPGAGPNFFPIDPMSDLTLYWPYGPPWEQVGAHGVIPPPFPDGCCLSDGVCVNVDPTDCVIMGGTPQGALCTGETEACCFVADGSGTCLDVDPLCCDDLGGVAQGAGSFCANSTVACCLPEGGCVDADATCCDALGGVPSPYGHAFCLGDNDEPPNGIDDACEPEPQPEQACCLPDATCADVTHDSCVAQFGDPQGPGTTCDDVSVVCHPLKWSQPPTFNSDSPVPECFWGWDEVSYYGQADWPIVADDWVCIGPEPVADIHWWGSYLNWDEAVPPADAPFFFYIGIWADDSSGLFGHPGDLVWQWVAARTSLNERAVACDFHPDFLTAPESCFKYDLDIPEAEWFYQAGGATVYWLSISAADMPGAHPWGWKTREHYFGDDAVRIVDPVAPGIGDAYVAGEPIEDGGGATWDMAFVLTTAETCPIANRPLPEPYSETTCILDSDCDNEATCIGGTCYVPKNRYISFVPNNGSASVAVRVTHVGSGRQWWVDEPLLVEPGVWVAGLVSDPVWRAWPEPVVHVAGCGTAPVALYDVQAIDAACDPENESNYSPALSLPTIAQPIPKHWGDCVGNFAGTWSPPNAVVSMDDLMAALQKFGSAPTAPPLVWVDVAGEEPNAILNMTDIQQFVGAFKGEAYPFSDPAECPADPEVLSYSNSGCLSGGSMVMASDDPYPFCGDDVVVFTAVEGGLHVLHQNVTYNCCPDDIIITLSVSNNDLHLTEEEILTTPCDCLCCYDVEANIGGLSPGTYNVDLCWQDAETGGEMCVEDIIEIP